MLTTHTLTQTDRQRHTHIHAERETLVFSWILRHTNYHILFRGKKDKGKKQPPTHVRAHTYNYSERKITKLYGILTIIDYLREKRVIKEKQNTNKKPESIYTYIDMSIHADIQTYRTHFCKKKKKRKKWKNENNTCRDENLSRKINSKWKFADTISGIKEKHNLIHRVATI